MKYIIQCEIGPEIGKQLEDKPQVIKDIVERWQALKPNAMYFSLIRRSITVILDAESEDAFFEPLHATWRATNSYPAVDAVVDGSEFPKLLKRIGVG